MTESLIAEASPALDIPFNRAPEVGNEAEFVRQAIANGHLSADGPFSRECTEWLKNQTGATEVLLVHSCTAALEMSVALLDIGPGDEVVMPSYTFTSTANAVALAGATPVFVDVDPLSYNLDVDAALAACNDRTKAIVPVHYAGMSCDLDCLVERASESGIAVIEDAAQGLMSTFRDRPLGAIGDLGAISFHETKNVTCGEGGALLLRDEEHHARAEILREKGTNRSRFFRGQVDKYTWVDLGSSHALSDLAAAFLLAQLEAAERTTARRLEIWNTYHEAFADIAEGGAFHRPVTPPNVRHNAHMYYITTSGLEERTRLIASLRDCGIQAVFHYVPLHSAPAGLKHGRVSGSLENTLKAGDRLVRLPLWPSMSRSQVHAVINAVRRFFNADEVHPND